MPMELNSEVWEMHLLRVAEISVIVQDGYQMISLLENKGLAHWLGMSLSPNCQCLIPGPLQVSVDGILFCVC